jgi:hypothetical protein
MEILGIDKFVQDSKYKEYVKNVMSDRATDNLYNTYSFDTAEYDFSNYSPIVISADNIEFVSRFDFSKTPENIINTILDIAEKYDTWEAYPKSSKFMNSNFIVTSTGDIYLGYKIREIKENLQVYKEAYKAFKNPKVYNRIEIKL